MAYFNLRCCDPTIGKYLIILFNALLAIMGIIHWAYAGVVQKYKSVVVAAAPNQSMSVLSDSHTAYYVIAGIIMVLVSVIIVLLVLQKLGNQNPLTWVRLILVLLIIEFGFNFFIAVQMSMFTNYWSIAYKSSIDAAKLAVENNSFSDLIKAPYWALLNWIRFSAAEAIITWIITLPCILAIMVSFFDQIFTEENAKKLASSNNQAKITQISPVPQVSMIGIK